MLVKSGIMAGLGETREELEALFRDLSGVGVQILTIGQYLQPDRLKLPAARFLPPEEFEGLSDLARLCGIPEVVSGPFVRSSYLAEASVMRARGANPQSTRLPGKMFDKGLIGKYNSG
jgi:lipoic acid synthetase